MKNFLPPATDAIPTAAGLVFEEIQQIAGTLGPSVIPAAESNTVIAAVCNQTKTVLSDAKVRPFRRVDQMLMGYNSVEVEEIRNFVKNWLKGTAHDADFSSSRKYCDLPTDVEKALVDWLALLVLTSQYTKEFMTGLAQFNWRYDSETLRIQAAGRSWIAGGGSFFYDNFQYFPDTGHFEFI